MKVKKVRNQIRLFWLFIRIWDIRTIWKKYTEKQWIDAEMPLDKETAWEVAKTIWEG
jgi:hypothetical protein